MNKNYKVGSFIVEMRKIKGLSQNDLAKELHITRKAISRWENGWGLPDSAILLSLAEVLGVTVDEILKGELSVRVDLNPNQLQTIEKMNEIILAKSKQKKMLNHFMRKRFIVRNTTTVQRLLFCTQVLAGKRLKTGRICFFECIQALQTKMDYR